MDPHLFEMLEVGDADDEVSAIVRLYDPSLVPPGVRLVARFADVATCRLRRRDIPAVRSHENVASLKAPDGIVPERSVSNAGGRPIVPSDDRRPHDLRATGRGVVVGVVDWGADVAHPNFRREDGRTRLLALWDQSRRPGVNAPAPYGYGTVLSADAIDRALASGDPYAHGYRPGDSDPGAVGTHGCHVMDIAAGSGRVGPAGLARAADLVFVQLSGRGTSGLATLGDSVALLEAVDFIAHVAGNRPWVINLSIGNHGGPHDGSTLVEQGFDRAVLGGPGRAIVQSCGNYFERHTHTFGWLRPGQVDVLTWDTDPADVTDNELEVWYSGQDRFGVEVHAPNGASVRVALGEHAALRDGGRVIARVYHRASDPNNGDHHVNVFVYPGGPAGAWRVRLGGEDVVDGKYHAWIERDEGCARCQSRFPRTAASSFSTTGTICNGRRTIAVGAYDAHAPSRPPAHFSSMGPTRDGRQKPDLCAPGVRVLAARSGPWDGAGMLTRKSGTSMAAPHVTGCIALMFEAAPRPLHIEETRRLLLSTAIPPADPARRVRIGSGYLDVEAAVDAARRVGARAPVRPIVKEQRMDANLIDPTDGDEIADTPRAALVDLADAVVMRRSRTPAAALLDELIGARLTPAAVFDALGGRRRTGDARRAHALFEVVAAPGSALAGPLEPGDWLVIRAPGEGGLAHVALLVDGRLIPAGALADAGLWSTEPGRGHYAKVIEAGPRTRALADGFARRVVDDAGRVRRDVMVVRLRSAVDPARGLPR